MNPRRGEGRGGPAQDPLYLLLDLGAVPVGERLGSARPLADLQRAEVEVGGDRGLTRLLFRRQAPRPVPTTGLPRW